jgi:hypothetical protein
MDGLFKVFHVDHRSACGVPNHIDKLGSGDKDSDSDADGDNVFFHFLVIFIETVSDSASAEAHDKDSFNEAGSKNSKDIIHKVRHTGRDDTPLCEEGKRGSRKQNEKQKFNFRFFHTNSFKKLDGIKNLGY